MAKRIPDFSGAGEVSVTLTCGRERRSFTVAPGFGPAHARFLQGVSKAIGSPVVAVCSVDRDGTQYPLAALALAAGATEDVISQAATGFVNAYNALAGTGEPYFAAPFDPKGRRWSVAAATATPSGEQEPQQEDCGAMDNASAGAAAKPKFRKEF